MALFRRKNQDTTEEVPAEVQEYYQAEKRERTGIAWLLALVTLVVTVLLAAALFFGGRWIYRNVFNSDDGQEQTAQQDAEDVDENEASSPSPTSDPTSESDTTNNGQSGSPAAPSTPSTPPSTPEALPRGPSSPSTSTAPTSQTPTTGPTAEEPLPASGPTENLAVFVAVTFFATILHYAFTARKNQA